MSDIILSKPLIWSDKLPHTNLVSLGVCMKNWCVFVFVKIQAEHLWRQTVPLAPCCLATWLRAGPKVSPQPSDDSANWRRRRKKDVLGKLASCRNISHDVSWSKTSSKSSKMRYFNAVKLQHTKCNKWHTERSPYGKRRTEKVATGSSLKNLL